MKVFLLVIICLLTIYHLKQFAECSSRWDDSQYSILGGCKVSHNGVHVPESNVRVIKWIEDNEEG